MTTVYARGQTQVRVNPKDPLTENRANEHGIVYAYGTGQVITSGGGGVVLRATGQGKAIKRKHTRVVLPWLSNHPLAGPRAPPELLVA